MAWPLLQMLEADTVKARVLFLPLAGATIAVILYLAIAGIGKADEPPTITTTSTTTVEVNATVQGKTATGWHKVAALYRRKLLIRWKPTVQYAYRLAAAIYGIPYWQLHNVGGCESTHYPYARNGIHRGIMQEGPMFESSVLGHAGFSVWDPIANVLVAASVVRSDGSWRQWECKP